MPIDTLFCGWDSATLFFFSENVFSNLIYYSHFGPLIVSIIVGVTVIANNYKSLLNRLLFVVTASFSLWVIFDLVLWASEKPELIMFFWSMIVPIELTIYAASWYFVAVFANDNKDITLQQKIFVFGAFLPLLIFAHTKLNLLGFDFTNCDREAIEGPLVQYLYFMELVFIALIIKTTVNGLKGASEHKRAQLLLLSIGTAFFLFTFSIGNILVSYFLEVDWSYEQYKLFGMPIFVIFIAYSTIKFNTFNVKLIASQALVTALAILVFSLLFLQTITTVRIVAFLTFVSVCVMGFLLVRSVKKEIKQREQLEELTEQLAAANERLKELDKLKSEFVSIASHQLRSPLTSMRGYASMLTDGSYGTIPEKAKEAVERIADSSAFMAKMVENYLNVSRIESGNMKYELSDFNLKQEVEKTVDDKRQEAMKKGLLLTFKSELLGQGIVHADIGKTLEIIHNLLNNALKYTPSGSIDVFVHDDQKKKKIYVDIHDSGIGMTSDDIAKLFGKFQRATNANSVNTTGTGLGLYVARTMALAMKGDITARSEGQGKGSTFSFELPEVM